MSPPNIRSLENEEDLQGIIESVGNRLLVMEFWATWCSACKTFLPFFHQICAKYEDVVFLQVDIDNLSELASNYGISRIPAIVFIKNGNVILVIDNIDKATIIHTIEKNK